MANFRVPVADTGIPNGVRDIADHLPKRSALASGDRITIDFERGQFVYLTGLVLLAAWRKGLPEGITVSIVDTQCSQPTKNLLTNAGFREVVETGHESPSVQRRVGRLPLRPITNRFNKDATVQEVTSIFEEYAGHVTDTKPFATLLGELCENVLAHSEAISPGYVCARVLEGDKRFVEIAVCDTGIGFRGSFAKGSNEEAKQRIAKGGSPIEIALEGLNSSKPVPDRGSYVSYYGFGLYVVRRLVEENRGQMTILSGDEMLALDRYGRKHHSMKTNFPGTFVALVLDLDNPLPLEEIYAQTVESYVGPRPTVASESRPPIEVSVSETAAITDTVSSSAASGVASPAEPPLSKRLEIKHFGTELLTREAGLAIRAEIATRLLANEQVTVALDGLIDITPSVADEAFAKLAERLGLQVFEKRVRFEGGSSLVRRLVEFVIRTRLR